MSISMLYMNPYSYKQQESTFFFGHNHSCESVVIIIAHPYQAGTQYARIYPRNHVFTVSYYRTVAVTENDVKDTFLMLKSMSDAKPSSSKNTADITTMLKNPCFSEPQSAINNPSHSINAQSTSNQITSVFNSS